MIDMNEAIARIKSAPTGAKTVYYFGHLAYDKTVAGGQSEPCKSLKLLSDLVYKAYLNGICALTQRKISENTYEYIATTLPAEGRTERSIRNWELFDSVRRDGVAKYEGANKLRKAHGAL